MLKTIYVLKSVSHGIIAYKDNKEEIINLYNQESNNGKYTGYSFVKLNIDRPINLNNLNDRLYLNSLSKNWKNKD